MADEASAVGSSSTGVDPGAGAAANDPAAASTQGLMSEYSTPNGLDTSGLATAVQAIAAENPQSAAQLSAELEAQMSPVEAGEFLGYVEVANDNATPAEPYSREVAGETFSVGHPDAPAVSTWGGYPPGDAYRDAWDRTAAEIGTTDAAAVTQAIEAQLYGPASDTLTELDTITVTADRQLQSQQAQSQRAQPSQESVGSFLEGAVLGDFGNNDSWSATAGQVAMGFVPIAGQIADARDTAAAIGQVWNGEEGGWLNLGAATIGWVPGIGDGIKAAIRGGEKIADAGTEVAQTAIRRGDVVVDDAARTAGGIPVRRFDNADDFNRAANDAAPNTTYSHGRYSYTTDDRGRVSVAEGRVQIDPVGRNDTDLQRQIGHEGRSTDVGFHVVADVLGGQTNRLNVVPGNGKPIGDGLANLNQGQYGQFERTLRELAADPDRTVEMRVEMRYNDGNNSNRPDEFVARYRVDGGRWREQAMINK